MIFDFVFLFSATIGAFLICDMVNMVIAFLISDNFVAQNKKCILFEILKLINYRSIISFTEKKPFPILSQASGLYCLTMFLLSKIDFFRFRCLRNAKWMIIFFIKSGYRNSEKGFNRNDCKLDDSKENGTLNATFKMTF
jgi:hypothetical protein